MVKHSQTIRWQLPTNCLSVIDYFAGLKLKGLNLDFLIFSVGERIEFIWLNSFEFQVKVEDHP